jgi:hypothetical protein
MLFVCRVLPLKTCKIQDGKSPYPNAFTRSPWQIRANEIEKTA